ncbi:hypothetical protein AAFF_G00309960 [Aldrovandia affinis]|uniref:Uncharacterized protein n=1 Tax=Aldrovandia affinis TaxID=143900 RepID=A0AAD7WRA9_9TELE|nr:hypothetical protein AAFF_G00309960 [Aldrovandia affinis]
MELDPDTAKARPLGSWSNGSTANHHSAGGDARLIFAGAPTSGLGLDTGCREQNTGGSGPGAFGPMHREKPRCITARLYSALRSDESERFSRNRI